MRQLQRLGIVFVVTWSAMLHVSAAENDLVIAAPDGERYAAEVPATLDLAERARLSVHALTSFLSAEADYSPYGHAFFNRHPAYMSSIARGTPNWGKISEGLYLARLMCGSRENQAIDQEMMRGMLRRVTLNPVAPTPVSRVMLALIAVYQVHPSPELRQTIQAMADAHVSAARHDERGAYYSDTPGDENDSEIGVLGHWLPVFVNGCAIRSLVAWYQIDGHPEHLDLARELVKFSQQPRYWSPEASPKAVATLDRGQFRGHIHSYLQLLLGLLEYAAATGDMQLLQQVRAGYEYVRNFGLAEIGLFGESCAVGDMTNLAIRLSDLGVGDYWTDVDRLVRNQLAEAQIIARNPLTELAPSLANGRAEMDMNSGPIVPPDDTADRVIERNVGAFLSDASHPTRIPPKSLMYTICCTGNCVPAMYSAWEAIVRPSGAGATVQLLLNRASPWLDVESHLPYEGRVMIRVKKATFVTLRIPPWVAKEGVAVAVDGQPRTPQFLERRLLITDLRPGNAVLIEFPLTTRTESYVLKWKQGDFWQESNDPGSNWSADPEPIVYRFSLRGDTVVDVQPRDPGPGLPLYQRAAQATGPAPRMSVERFVATRLPGHAQQR